jgi:hypothetical protein
MATLSSLVPNGFTRKLVRMGDRTLIESTCRACGRVILGTTMDETLPAAEEKHLAECDRGPTSVST